MPTIPSRRWEGTIATQKPSALTIEPFQGLDLFTEFIYLCKSSEKKFDKTPIFARLLLKFYYLKREGMSSPFQRGGVSSGLPGGYQRSLSWGLFSNILLLILSYNFTWTWYPALSLSQQKLRLQPTHMINACYRLCIKFSLEGKPSIPQPPTPCSSVTFKVQKKWDIFHTWNINMHMFLFLKKIVGSLKKKNPVRPLSRAHVAVSCTSAFFQLQNWNKLLLPFGEISL